jgi:hypothetical protein
MARSRRCSLCGVNYPLEARFLNCPVHEETATSLSTDSPTAGWDLIASLVLLGVEQQGAGPVAGPILCTVGGELIDGRYFIGQTQLTLGGVTKNPLDPGDVLEIRKFVENPAAADGPCDCLFEVMGWAPSLGRYWLHPLIVPNEPPLDWGTPGQ